jgi:hypothetical protein
LHGDDLSKKEERKGDGWAPAALLQRLRHPKTKMETCTSSIARELCPDGKEKMSGPTNKPPYAQHRK